MLSSVKLVLLLGLSVCLVRSEDKEDDIIVESPGGKFRGHLMKTRGDRDILAFQGIPYAEPPLGKLRFKEALKKEILEDIWDANDESKECYQPIFNPFKLNNMTDFKGTEDCLYLNVYTLRKKERTGPLPVFVWIHGGGFFMASGSTFYNGPEFLLNKDMILVTMNYRLGILGFLSTGDSVLPGNLGMKDQVMALRWVQENIASFGGDPNSVTLGGESAGGAAVTQHMHSNLSKGLFHRVIAQSGTIHSLWSTKTIKESRSWARKLAGELGCSFKSKNLIKCLQKMPVNELFLAGAAIKEPLSILSMDFVPVIERESADGFLSESSMATESNTPLLLGVTSMETLSIPFFLASTNPKYGFLSGLREDEEKLFPIVGYYRWHPRAEHITRELIQFYMGQEGITDTSHQQLIEMMSDIMFNHPTHVMARNNKGKTYLYMFSYKGDVNHVPMIPKQLESGVAHSEDLLYLFNFKFIPRGESNEADKNMSEQVVDAWYNFIRTGDPTPESKVWPESEGGVKYLDITNEGLIVKSDMFKSRMDFLDTLNIKKERKTGKRKHEEL